jgi:hypothetical protein
MNSFKLVFFLITFLVIKNTSAQDSITENLNSNFYYPRSISINIGVFNKIRGKFEYRFNQKNSLALSVSRHYGAINPGAQSFLEYRRFYKENGSEEYFAYAKIGAGKSFTFNGTYALFGLGVGQQVNLGKSNSFFLQISEGLKVCPSIHGDVEAEPGTGFRGLFYVIGPGAFIDINLSFGFRF